MQYGCSLSLEHLSLEMVSRCVLKYLFLISSHDVNVLVSSQFCGLNNSGPNVSWDFWNVYQDISAKHYFFNRTFKLRQIQNKFVLSSSAMPVLGTGKLRGKRKAIQPGRPDYEANSKLAIQRQTKFLKCNMKWKMKNKQ